MSCPVQLFSLVDLFNSVSLFSQLFRGVLYLFGCVEMCLVQLFCQVVLFNCVSASGQWYHVFV